jgi:hypothetical protein
MALFELGQVVATSGAMAELSMDDINTALSLYVKGNWGELEEDDWKMNDEAVKHNNDRIVAKYKSSNGVNFYIITEWDRSYTTILLPSEY